LKLGDGNAARSWRPSDSEYRKFLVHAEKVAIRKREKFDEDSEIGSVVEGRRKSGVVGFTDAVNEGVASEVPRRR
jgi:hypothetical protein